MRAPARRGLVPVLVSALVAVLALVAPAASAAPATIERYAGSDRFATAAAVSRAGFAPGVGVVYVVSGVKFPDALAAAPRAAADGAPVLLVRPTDIPAAVATELDRLNPGRVVVLGGPETVSTGVEQQLAAYTSGGVTRVAGADRFATAARLASTFPAGVDVAYIAAGAKFPDALAGAAVAGLGDDPLLLVGGTSLHPAVAEALRTLRPGRLVILGDRASVSTEIEAELAGYAPVSRVGGTDRFATAAQLSATAFPDGADTVYLTTGWNFPDALAGAAVAGRDGGPVLLVTPTAIPGTVATELARLGASKVVVLGSEASVSASVAAQAAGQVTDPILADNPVVTLPPSWDEIGRIDATYTSPPVSRGAGKIALEWAKTQIGKPYGWGQAGPDAYDCSGLILRAYEQAGVQLRRMTKDQWYDTRRVALDEMVPGDLMFWSSNGQPSGIYHSAIYAGNGMRVHAPSPGKFVELVPVWSGNLLPYGGRIG
ncbi:cell wall-binding repeat-containing protein [Georgenia muralis]|uniref:Cell wall-associated NlpC family hydrolase n=1 Tax=Georgenia muralis TaxID=154117 RepID=A0A3N4ZKF0_9MICO|nr:cell wall-binding repeat-containing protein [Georgenia muralis]RPF26288.1 cell wall-associated NlpC family hydrolase [Georgenia muralis]